MKYQSKKEEFNRDGDFERTYDGTQHDSRDYFYEYEEDDVVPEWVRSPEAIERMKQRDIADFNASKKKRHITLGTAFNLDEYIKSQD